MFNGLDLTHFLGFLFLDGMLLAFAYHFKHHVPSKINQVYGYRTSKSMKNQKMWKEANNFSGNLFLKLSLLVPLVQLLLIIIWDAPIAFKSTALIVIVMAVVLYILTERHLNKIEEEDNI